MFFGILDDKGSLDYINAGHPSPILIRRNGTPDEAFTEGSFPVGLVPEAEYCSASVKLDPGDTLVLFSDGVTEAMDPQEELFGVPRLKQFLVGHNETPLDELQKLLLEAVENFARGASQADDLTLLLVRYRAVGAASEPELPRTITSASAG
jgi:sigma-B regulation protein RsbU (phosphoserine phosphatase)